MTHHTLSKQCEPESAASKTGELSPFVLEFFLVQGAGFRCMAYRDEEGTWRGAFNHEALAGEIYILE